MNIGNSQQQVLPYGAILKAKSPGLWPDHLGIFGEPLPDGTPTVIHSNGVCVVHTSIGEFALGRMVEVTDAPCTLEHQRAILGRAYSQIGHPYHALVANCEHFATWAFNGAPESPQLKNYVVSAFVVGLGLWGLWGSGGESA